MRQALLALARRLPRGYSPLLRWCARRWPALREHTVAVAIGDGRAFYVDLSEPVCHPLFRWGCYPHQRALDSLLERLVQPGDTVIDVGANIGYVTRVCWHAMQGRGRIVSVEPARRCQRLLHLNTHGLCGVEVRQAALSDSGGSASFREMATLDTSHLTPPGCGPSPLDYEVECLTLDGLAGSLAETSPLLVKIDVEGHEASVLRGAQELLATRQPIVVFESLQPEALRQCVELFAAVPDAGYSVRSVANGAAPRGAETREPLDSDWLALPRRARGRI